MDVDPAAPHTQVGYFDQPAGHCERLGLPLLTLFLGAAALGAWFLPVSWNRKLTIGLGSAAGTALLIKLNLVLIRCCHIPAPQPQPEPQEEPQEDPQPAKNNKPQEDPQPAKNNEEVYADIFIAIIETTSGSQFAALQAATAGLATKELMPIRTRLMKQASLPSYALPRFIAFYICRLIRDPYTKAIAPSFTINFLAELPVEECRNVGRILGMELTANEFPRVVEKYQNHSLCVSAYRAGMLEAIGLNAEKLHGLVRATGDNQLNDLLANAAAGAQRNALKAILATPASRPS